MFLTNMKFNLVKVMDVKLGSWSTSQSESSQIIRLYNSDSED